VLSIHELLSSSPLYEGITLTHDDWGAVRNVFCKHLQADLYCPECKNVSTFRTQLPGVASNAHRIEAQEAMSKVMNLLNWEQKIWETKQEIDFPLTMFCSRSPLHIAKYYFLLHDGELIKIGQRPSLADMASAEVRKYQKVLGSERVQELQRAIGLAAHGVGIGSFVYLRRIFESLVEEHRKATDPDGTLFPDWNQKRMGDRIKALASSLPVFLVSNTQLHGVLSAGVHTLSDDQCRAAFPVVKAAILLILQQDHERAEKAKMEKTLAADLTKLGSQLGEIT
jgi:hypothetical protein